MLNHLPTNWQIKTLGEVFLIERGGSPRPIKNFLTNDENGINWIKIGDTKNVSKYIYSTAEKIKPEGKKHSRFVEIGDLILSNSMSFGRPYIMKTTGCIHDGWVVFRNTKKLIDEEYAYYALISNQIYAEFSKLATGSTVKNLSIDRIKQVAIPLPPLEIQKRIVAKLESAFEKIEKGSAHLQDAKTKLAKYKQSLLKSAFNGTLFCHIEGEARSIPNQESRDISLTLNMTNSPSLRANKVSVAIQNNDTTKAIDCHSPNGLRNDSTHSSLRGSAADEAIHKVDCHKSANANFHNDDKSVDCHDLTSSNLAMTDKENPKLPQGWTIKTLKSFGIFIRGVSYKKEQLLKEKTTNSVFLLRANNIQEKLDLTDLQIVPKELADGKIIQDNDIVFAMSSGSKHIVGKNIILSNLQDYSFGAFCGLFRITNKDLNSHYLAYFLQSDFYRKYIVKFAKGTNINNLRFNDLENLQIPLPPLEIQKQIVKLLEKHLQHADKTGEFIESALNKAKQLKQSLLKSAFLGRLT